MVCGVRCNQICTKNPLTANDYQENRACISVISNTWVFPIPAYVLKVKEWLDSLCMLN